MSHQPHVHDRALELNLTERIFAHNSAPHRCIAERVGVTNAAICHWRLGRNFPGSFAMWQRLARAVGAKLRIELEFPNGNR